MKKVFVLLLVFVLSSSLMACGGQPTATKEETTVTQAEVTEATEATTEEKYNPMVDTIDYTYEDCNTKYVKILRADKKLTDEKNAYLFVFDFTNSGNEPKDFVNTFITEFYQNGVQLQNASSFTSEAEDQYELANNAYSNVLGGGTATCALIVCLKDESPVTIRIFPNGDSQAPYQMMEVPLNENKATNVSEESSNVSKDDIDKLLQGKWYLESNGKDTYFTFESGNYALGTPDGVQEGTYEINTDESQIVAKLIMGDQKMTIRMPYEYTDGTLVLKNNHDEELTKE